ncbi:threonine/serine exporter family protein [Paenibacillus sp. SZ31]|uniref:DUF3784 domain-containing protein n=1 Tax=Paenibacillus sp. SZ31 TaxID=2725555 RepID=UPI00146F3D64|nr:DUF3784 domain-containing protein [Paenibacillus sp. SZ31]NMI05518.1 threonine/serine exporter family protein [Paenibacillus sp. SZ31]
MKRFFGIILIIISCLTILFSLIMLSEGTEMAIFSTIVFFIPGVIVLVTGIKMCGRPKSRSNTDQYHHNSNDKQYYQDQRNEKYEEKDEPQESVAVNCSGCGAKVKVYPTLSADCEYCGTTMRIS